MLFATPASVAMQSSRERDLVRLSYDEHCMECIKGFLDRDMLKAASVHTPLQ
jgi:hypothetical protein